MESSNTPSKFAFIAPLFFVSAVVTVFLPIFMIGHVIDPIGCDCSVLEIVPRQYWAKIPAIQPSETITLTQIFGYDFQRIYPVLGVTTIGLSVLYLLSALFNARKFGERLKIIDVSIWPLAPLCGLIGLCAIFIAIEVDFDWARAFGDGQFIELLIFIAVFGLALAFAGASFYLLSCAVIGVCASLYGARLLIGPDALIKGFLSFRLNSIAPLITQARKKLLTARLELRELGFNDYARELAEKLFASDEPDEGSQMIQYLRFGIAATIGIIIIGVFIVFAALVLRLLSIVFERVIHALSALGAATLNYPSSPPALDGLFVVIAATGLLVLFLVLKDAPERSPRHVEKMVRTTGLIFIALPPLMYYIVSAIIFALNAFGRFLENDGVARVLGAFFGAIWSGAVYISVDLPITIHVFDVIVCVYFWGGLLFLVDDARRLRGSPNMANTLWRHIRRGLFYILWLYGCFAVFTLTLRMINLGLNMSSSTIAAQIPQSWGPYELIIVATLGVVGLIVFYNTRRRMRRSQDTDIGDDIIAAFKAGADTKKLIIIQEILSRVQSGQASAKILSILNELIPFVPEHDPVHLAFYQTLELAEDAARRDSQTAN